MNPNFRVVLQRTLVATALVIVSSSGIGVLPGDDSKPEPAAAKENAILITVRGQASDERGNPLPGARVYLASIRGDPRRIAETDADAEGRFEFKKATLPVELADQAPGRCFGAFEVFGHAPGFGFAWQPATRVNAALDADDPPDDFNIDLTFPASAKLGGRVVNEKDEPLSDSHIEIRYCMPLRVTQYRSGHEFFSLNQRDSVPGEMKVRVTDKDGQFEFDGLPTYCRFRIDVQPKGNPRRWIWAATTDEPQGEFFNSKVMTGEIKLAFVTPVEIPIRVVADDNGQPAAKVMVSLFTPLASTWGETDSKGTVALKVPPGEYNFELLPARGTPYLVRSEKLEVGKTAATEPIVGKLRPAAVVDVVVVDEHTEEPIAGLDVWRETQPAAVNRRPFREEINIRSWEKPIAFVDRPRTDKSGRLRVLLEPGVHRIGVGLHVIPKGYRVVESDGLEIDCEAGKTITVMFFVRKL